MHTVYLEQIHSQVFWFIRGVAMEDEMLLSISTNKIGTRLVDPSNVQPSVPLMVVMSGR
jgi:hypothetical protein